MTGRNVESQDPRAARLAAVSRLLVRVLVTGALVFAVELAWLIELSHPVDAATLVQVAGQSLGLVTVGWLVVGGLAAASRSLAGARHAWVLAALSLPLTWLVANSVLGGERISEMTGIGAIRVGAAVGLAVGVWLAVGLFGRVVAAADRPRAGLRVALVVAAFVGASWLDTHRFVGHYPAFHHVLGFVGLCAAALLAMLVVPARAQVAKPLAGVALLLLVAAPLAVQQGWSSNASMNLATASNGFAPRIREAVVAMGRLDEPADRAADPLQVVDPDAWLALVAEEQARQDAARQDAPALESFAQADDAPVAHALEVAPEPVVETRPLHAGNVLQHADALDQDPWFAGASPPEVVADAGLAPDGTRTAELVSYVDSLSTVIQISDYPAAERHFRAEVWARLPEADELADAELTADATADAQPPVLRALLMDGRSGHYGSSTLVLSQDWQRLEVTKQFGPDDQVGGVTLRIDNGYGGASAFDVLLWGAELTELPPRPSVLAAPPPPVAEAEPRGPRESLRTSGQEFRFEPTSGEGPDRVRAETRNVILVIMDGLRMDHVGPREGGSLTPVLDGLRDDAVLFESVYSPSNSTGTAMPALMSSLPEPVVRRLVPFDLRVRTWLDELNGAGYRTLSNGNCDYVTRKRTHIKMSHSYGGAEQRPSDGRGPEMLEQMLAFARSDDARPFAMYSHWMDPHISTYSGDVPEVYKQKVREADARLGRLVDALRESGLYESTMLVVTADHGYSLGEGNRFLGSQGLTETQVRVPLWMHVPGSGFDGLRVAANASGTSVPLTILDCVLPDADVLSPSRSLLGTAFAAVDGPVPNDHLVTASREGRHVLRQGGSKVIWNGDNDTQLLFDIAADPEERRLLDDADERQRLCDLLRDELRRYDRCAFAIVSRQRGDLDGNLVDLLVDPQARDEDLAEVVPDFWTYEPSAQQLLLKTIALRSLKGLRAELDALERGQWTQADQQLLVTRAVLGSDGAAATLGERWIELDGTARQWFAHSLRNLPDAALAAVGDDLAAELARLAALEPALGSADETFLSMAAFNLAGRRRLEAPEDIKATLARQYNLYEAPRPRHAISTLYISNFHATYMLDALRDSVDHDELHVLDELRRTQRAGRTIVKVCQRLDSEASRQYVLDMLRDQGDQRFVESLVPHLREFEDREFRARCEEVVQQRFPGVDSLL